MLDREGNVIPGDLLDMDLIAQGLSVLERQVRETWLASDYPPDVQSNFAQFRHALTHLHKASGKLPAIVDHEEHQRFDRESTEAAAEAPKLLADLVRCAAKMAESLGISLSLAYTERAQQLAERWGH